MMRNDRETITPPSADENADRRKFQRVRAPLRARFLGTDGQEHNCVVVNVSAGGALLKAKNPPEFGAAILLYIDRIGRFEARVIRSSQGSFAVAYEKNRRKNARTAASLTQLVNQSDRHEERRGDLRVRENAPARVYFDDGRIEDCTILDISLTGASVEIAPRPPLGTRLILGRMKAKVVRRHETGVGVIFTGPAERIADVVTETTLPVPEQNNGPQVANPFGKKNC